MRVLGLVVLATVVLAGCSGGKAADKSATHPTGLPAGTHMLQGFVFDDAIHPLEGALVKVLDTNASFTADKEGAFHFDGLPTEQFLVLVASKPGYQPQSKQVTLTPTQAVLLNFTLSAVPQVVSYTQQDKHVLQVDCQLAVVANGQNMTQDCGTGTAASQGTNAWTFPVSPALVGCVVEVFWDPTTAAANTAGAKLETQELGQLNLVLGEVVGPSPLRIYVAPSVAQRYYASGGLMKLTVHAASDSTQQEAGVGAAALVNQNMRAYYTEFYGTPPPPTYTIADQS